jgi:hypothetical protein
MKQPALDSLPLKKSDKCKLSASLFLSVASLFFVQWRANRDDLYCLSRQFKRDPDASTEMEVMLQRPECKNQGMKTLIVTLTRDGGRFAWKPWDTRGKVECGTSCTKCNARLQVNSLVSS